MLLFLDFGCPDMEFDSVSGLRLRGTAAIGKMNCYFGCVSDDVVTIDEKAII